MSGKAAYMLQPTLEEACNLLKDALSKKRFIIAAGLCRVEYTGRASSKLDWGERVLLIKPDSSLLLHRARGLRLLTGSLQVAYLQSSWRATTLPSDRIGVSIKRH